MKFGALLAACLGIVTAVYLIFYVGLAPVFSAASSLGWGGFALYCGLGGTLFALLGTAWCVLIPADPAKRWSIFFWGRAVRDSAAEVLPLSQFGGYVIGARAVALRGISAADAYASTVVDVTTETLAQILFIILGAALFVRHLGFHSHHSHVFVPLLFGPVLAALGVTGFIILQQRGPVFAEKLATRLLPQAVGHAGAFARSIGSIYASPWRVVSAIAIHFCGWMSSAFVNWIAVRLIGGHSDYLSRSRSKAHCRRSAARRHSCRRRWVFKRQVTPC